MASAAETQPFRSRRRRRFRERALTGSTPFLLIVPLLVVMATILGYPLYWLFRLSTQQYGLFQLIAHHGTSVGLKNFSSVLHDQVFWHTLVRTVVFTAVNVGLTMGLGLLIALLLTKLSAWVRVLLSSGLVLVWAMPVVVAVQVWYWMTNFQNGVLNYVLTQLHLGNFDEVDGARPWRVFRDITLPILRPILLILTSLSIIWDFGVFTQPYLLIGQSKITPGNYLMSVYLWEEGYFKTDFGRGAAISILMLFIVALLSVAYVRRMVRIGREVA